MKYRIQITCTIPLVFDGESEVLQRLVESLPVWEDGWNDALRPLLLKEMNDAVVHSMGMRVTEVGAIYARLDAVGEVTP